MIIDQQKKAIEVVNAIFAIDIGANWESRRAIYVVARRLISVWLLYNGYTVVEIGQIMKRDHSTISYISGIHCNYIMGGDKYSRVYAVAFEHFMALMQGKEPKETMTPDEYNYLIYRPKSHGKKGKGLPVSR